MRGAIVRRPKQLVRGMVERVLELSDERRRIDEKTSPATKVALRSLLHSYQRQVAAGEPLPSIHDSGFRMFSQFDEDGVVLYLLGAGGMETRRFVDLGAGDGVYASNCANLALNLGFDGLFVEGDAAKAAPGAPFLPFSNIASSFIPRTVRKNGTHSTAAIRPTSSNHQ